MIKGGITIEGLHKPYEEKKSCFLNAKARILKRISNSVPNRRRGDLCVRRGGEVSKKCTHFASGITSTHTEFELQDGPQTNGLLTSFDAACVAGIFIIIAPSLC